MEVLVLIFSVLVFAIAGAYVYLISRRRFREDAMKLGEDFDEDAEEIPGPDVIVSSMDLIYKSYVCANLSVITGTFVTANWNEGHTELEVSVKISDDEVNEKVLSFVEKLQKENPVVKIHLEWY